MFELGLNSFPLIWFYSARHLVHQLASVRLCKIRTLCLVICWVILAVWVPMGSAELRRLSVALSHSPSGSRPSWNCRAKTCSSSNFLCLKGHKKKNKNKKKKQEGHEKMTKYIYFFTFYSYNERVFLFQCFPFKLHRLSPMQLFLLKEQIISVQTFPIRRYYILRPFNTEETSRIGWIVDVVSQSIFGQGFSINHRELNTKGLSKGSLKPQVRHT